MDPIAYFFFAIFFMLMLAAIFLPKLNRRRRS